jgi:hypothetical protein
MHQSSFEARQRWLAPPAMTAKPLRRDDGGYADSYANLRSGSPLNQTSMPSTIWL